MKEIVVTSKVFGNKVALVDDDDYEFISKHKWYLHNGGYARTTYNNKGILMHRMVLRCTGHIDHKNRNGLDNRKINIRPCTRSQNMANRKVKSKYRGVYQNGGTIFAAIVHKSTFYYLGKHNSKREAAMAYNKKAIELHGEFATINIL